MDGKKWSIVNTIVSAASFALGLVGIVTGIKSAEYEEEKQFKEIEERYGLTPFEKETE